MKIRQDNLVHILLLPAFNSIAHGAAYKPQFSRATKNRCFLLRTRLAGALQAPRSDLPSTSIVVARKKKIFLVI